MNNFFENFSSFVVLAATLVIWMFLFFYLVKIEKRIRRIEKTRQLNK
ncbi:MAG: CcmD family protein [Ignavibacteriae bacterium]|nr:MAG: CcmD family protein [Ignavibacteriota bacterium]